MRIFESVTDESFHEGVIASYRPVLVYFWAEWCEECQPLKQVLDTVAAEKGERIKVVFLNVDENPRTTRVHAIQMVPTLILFISGSEQERVEGLTNHAHLSGTIEMHLRDEVNGQPDLGEIA